MAFLRYAALVAIVISVLPLLFVLKAIEIYSDYPVPMAGTPASATQPSTRPVDFALFKHASWEAVQSRIENVSMWNVMGTGLTGVLIVLAAVVVHLVYRFSVRWRDLLTAAIISSVLLWLYLRTMKQTNETLYAWQVPTRGGYFAFIQYIEGVAVCTVIVIAPFFLPMAFAVLRELKERHDSAKKPQGHTNLLKAAGLLHTAAVGPFLLIVLGLFFGVAYQTLVHTPLRWFSGLHDFLKRAMFLFIAYLPFSYLLIRVRRALPRIQFSPVVKEPGKVVKLLLSLLPVKTPSLVYFSAEWKNDAFTEAQENDVPSLEDA